MVFSYFFTNPLDFATAASPSYRDSPYVLRCDEAIPEFTLSGKVIPSKSQVDEICGCIWSKLSPWAKDVSTVMVSANMNQVSEIKIRAFISDFGKKIEACNTENL